MTQNICKSCDLLNKTIIQSSVQYEQHNSMSIYKIY